MMAYRLGREGVCANASAPRSDVAATTPPCGLHANRAGSPMILFQTSLPPLPTLVTLRLLDYPDSSDSSTPRLTDSDSSTPPDSYRESLAVPPSRTPAPDRSWPWWYRRGYVVTSASVRPSKLERLFRRFARHHIRRRTPTQTRPPPPTRSCTSSSQLGRHTPFPSPRPPRSTYGGSSNAPRAVSWRAP
jgi:hypothetical protein